ncbi:hypothetical protein [Lacticaseibacillus rhamnosus]|uniref:hypothetical protein n=1 Tax=Lacticaseibacillus rhamnosus TaxID=47715 RepID=UPI0012DAF1F5|nr:hypothetical protein [Lacticaseibacillus rhamnosus]
MAYSVEKIDDKDLLFGIGNKIDFIYVNDEFVLGPKSKNFFERFFFLNSEYKKKAIKTAAGLIKYSDKLKGIAALKNDIDTGKKPFVIEMLAKIGSPSYFEELEKKLSNSNSFKESLKNIEQFQKDPEFSEKFKNPKIDSAQGTITYNKDSIYEFLAVLSDRPKETLLLRNKELGS